MIILVQFFLCGLITSLIFPPFFLMPIGFITYPFLFYLINKKEYLELGYIFHFFSGFIYGFGFLIIFLIWIKEPFLLNSLTEKFSIFSYLLIFYCSFYFSFAFILLKYFKSTLTKFVILPIVFIFNEMICANLGYGFPWISYSLIHSSNESVFFIIYFIGTYGLGYLTLVIFLFPIIFLFHASLNFRNILIVYFIIFILIFTLFLLRVSKIDISNNTYNISVSLAQMNFLLNQNINEKISNQKYKKIIKILKENNTDVLIFAENNFPYLVKNNQILLSLQDNLDPNTNLILGLTKKEDEKLYNSLFLINAENIINFDKKILVPFGEFIPFRKIFSFMEIIAGSKDFSIGKEKRIISMNNHLNFIPVICYEIIFFWKLINDNNKNADLIINITNDSWFGTLSGPYQHFYFARLRAAEFNKPIIRVSNNGISAVIDNFGNIIDYIQLNKKEVKKINIQIPKSTYNLTQYHHLILYVIFLLFLYCLFLNRKNGS